MKEKVLALSFQTVAELWAWPENNSWGERQREGMDAFLHRFLVIPYDFELAKVWARVGADARRKGRPLLAGDQWIAATAVHRKLPLLTTDHDFTDLDIPGLEIIFHEEGG